MTEISFNVRGIPIPQGSKNSRAWIDKATGKPRACLYDQKSNGLQAWRTAIAQEARNAVCPIDCLRGIPGIDCHKEINGICEDQLLGGALEVECAFTFMPSKSRLKLLEKQYGKGKEWYPHEIKPDLDKLLRAVCDALTGIVFKDDCQIWRFNPSPQKIFSTIHQQGCKIRVITCD